MLMVSALFITAVKMRGQNGNIYLPLNCFITFFSVEILTLCSNLQNKEFHFAEISGSLTDINMCLCCFYEYVQEHSFSIFIVSN